jgi:hypothetical protein
MARSRKHQLDELELCLNVPYQRGADYLSFREFSRWELVVRNVMLCSRSIGPLEMRSQPSVGIARVAIEYVHHQRRGAATCAACMVVPEIAF